MKTLNISVYRYNPDVDNAPYMKDYTLEVEAGRDMMVLDVLLKLKSKTRLWHSVAHAVKVCVVLTV